MIDFINGEESPAMETEDGQDRETLLWTTLRGKSIAAGDFLSRRTLLN